jgi:hypothetical protein
MNRLAIGWMYSLMPEDLNRASIPLSVFRTFPEVSFRPQEPAAFIDKLHFRVLFFRYTEVTNFCQFS